MLWDSIVDGISSFITNIGKDACAFQLRNQQMYVLCIHVLSVFSNTFLNDAPLNSWYELSIIKAVLEHFSMTHSTLKAEHFNEQFLNV